MEKDACILVTGGGTLIGAAILRQLRGEGFARTLGGTDAEPDWTDGRAVEDFFSRAKPGYVFHAAGKSAGISGNQKYPADLIWENLLGEAHVVRCAHRYGVKKLLYLASSCSYPKHCPQPMREEYLLTGPLEPTNEAYAVAKIAGIVLCRAYRQQHGSSFVAGIPANAFGPGDDFSPEDSHVIAALLRRFHEATVRGDASVEIWGTGSPRREFIYAPDLARACICVMQRYEEAGPINLGCGSDVSIAELARAAREVTGFRGEITFDAGRPDGMLVKLLDSMKLNALGWKPETGFREALEATYAWYLESLHRGAGQDPCGSEQSDGSV